MSRIDTHIRKLLNTSASNNVHFERIHHGLKSLFQNLYKVFLRACNLH